MSDFTEHSLDDGAFGQAKGISVQAFDAFPKTKSSYQKQTSSGGVWTVILTLLSCLLGASELRRWWIGTTSHTFSVEKGISHDLQINIDMVVAMQCDHVRVNIQDAAGDRILAGETLSRAPVNWIQYGMLNAFNKATRVQDYEEDDVHDHLGFRRKRKFPPTPKIWGKANADACRLYGSLDGNKVQGDFHITARGHGYMDFEMHLDHTAFNFSHHIHELSFGPYYPSLHNPLDNTRVTTDSHFHKYQYYLSVVPTIYTTDANQLARLDPSTNPSSSDEATDKSPARYLPNTVFTNQYAVTEQSRQVPDTQVPGIFVRFDIEPILLTIAEEKSSFLALLVRLVNVVSGILVAGGWCFQVSEWAKESGYAGLMRSGSRRRADSSMGFLHGRKDSVDVKVGMH